MATIQKSRQLVPPASYIEKDKKRIIVYRCKKLQKNFLLFCDYLTKSNFDRIYLTQHMKLLLCPKMLNLLTFHRSGSTKSICSAYYWACSYWRLWIWWIDWILWQLSVSCMHMLYNDTPESFEFLVESWPVQFFALEFLISLRVNLTLLLVYVLFKLTVSKQV